MKYKVEKRIWGNATAIYDADYKYRYVLEIIWTSSKPLLLFVMLNPSTATEKKLDPTVRKCVHYAKTWGYGGIVILNIFALRSTDPGQLYLVKDPIGKLNDKYIMKYARNRDVKRVIVAFGNHGDISRRGKKVVRMLRTCRTLYCLGHNQSGNPRHPLFLRKDLKPRLYL